ncbi:MAG: MerR family transcriptional regulator [Bdellovibrionales bacterium]|nr:MerR family transcriptional regulator [Bdellovibrionales bacterium]
MQQQDMFETDPQNSNDQQVESTQPNSTQLTMDGSPSEPPMLLDEELLNEITNIPDKMAFKIGDVAQVSGVKTYVLRYWESEFDELKPKKSKHNQRMYSKKDVEYVLIIKKLLYRDRFSIDGARAALKRLKKDGKNVRKIKEGVSQIKDIHTRMENLIERVQKLKSDIL